MRFNVALIALFIVMLVAPLRADVTVEFPFGSITGHYPFDFYRDGAPNFKIPLTKNGLLIFNPMLGMCLTTQTNQLYGSITMFFGDNSTGSPMAGFYVAGGFFLDRWFYIGAVAGMYIQSDTAYRAVHNAPYPVVIGDNDIVPLLGIEAVIRTDITPTLFLKSRLVILPVLATFSFALGFRL